MGITRSSSKLHFFSFSRNIRVIDLIRINIMENTNNVNKAPEATSANKNILMAVLSYIGPLVIISYVTAKDDLFVKYHIKQGLVLFTAEIALWALGMFLWILIPIINIAQFIVVILSIIGIVNALGAKEKELPFVGKYASHFKI